MINIAYYISSHGYGHAARQGAIIEQLARHDVMIHMRTAAPRKFFASAQHYHEQRYDIGMIQHDALSINVEASLQWMADFLRDEEEKLIAQEIDFIQQENIQLIVSDMPPIACEIAARVGIPSIVITHFTWDWVYAHYMDAYPQYAYIVEHLREQYLKATLALQMQLPLPHDFDMFKKVEPIGLVYNAVTKSREAIREEFAIPEDKAMVLLSMGGHQWGRGNISMLRDYPDMVFLVMPSIWEQVKDTPEQFRTVPMSYDDYHNLIAAADVMVGKTGGSTVAEVLGHRTPMIYTTQSENDWREVRLLSNTLDEYAVSQYVPMSDFLAGEWASYLPQMLNHNQQWQEIDRDGVQQAVRQILSFLVK